MARAVKDSKLDTRTARAKLHKRGKPYYRALDRGLHLGYRRGKASGRWVVRYVLPGGKYKVTTLPGVADDMDDADGKTVFSFSQAQEKARATAKQITGANTEPKAVDAAMEDYLSWYEANNRPSGYQFARTTIDTHILPALGEKLVADLKTHDVQTWFDRLTLSPARLRGRKGAKPVFRPLPDKLDDEAQRKRKATANRILVTLKAGLSFARSQDLDAIPSDAAWRNVKPHKSVDKERAGYYSEEEAARIVNAADPDFRQLVKGALMTGCRYSSLIAMKCGDLTADGQVISLYVRVNKKSKPYSVGLTDGGAAFFKALTAGRAATDFIFLRADGKQWARYQQIRPMRAALKRAQITRKDVSFHTLRHTFASHLAMARVSMAVIAQALGHTNSQITEKHYAHLAPNHVTAEVCAHLPAFGVDANSNIVELKHAK
jgi:integrase